MDLAKKYWVPVVLYLVAFFILPPIMIRQIDDGFGLVIINLIFINSITVFFSTCYVTYKFGLDWLHLIMMTLLFLISCFVVWNSSAIGYLILYAIVYGFALLIGYFFRKIIPSHT